MQREIKGLFFFPVAVTLSNIVLRSVLTGLKQPTNL